MGAGEFAAPLRADARGNAAAGCGQFRGAAVRSLIEPAPSAWALAQL
jgi:hypothetical protein